jgi:multiple sugar transport system substrate-binding protein
MIENLTWQLEVWALSNGSGFYSEDGSKVIINERAATDALQKIADLYLVHHVAPLSAGLTDDGVQRSLIAGTCAMTTNGAWNVGTCLASARDEGLNCGVAVLPYMKEKVTITTGGPNVVFSQSKHPQEAMEWVKWYMQEENSWDLISAGIWMPVLEKWYTDEELTRKWVENPNFPPYKEYKEAVVDYALEHSRPTSWYYVNNTNDFNTLLGSLLGDVWTGKVTAKEAIEKNYDSLVAAFNGQL